MPIAMTCPRCSKTWTLSEGHGLREAVCPGCGMLVPTATAFGPTAFGPTVAPPADPPPERKGLGLSAAAPLIGGRKKTEYHDLIDMTAMVDVVFFLLIFFLVTSMAEIQASLEIPAPDPQQSAAKAAPTIEQFEKDGDFVIVRIDQDDTVWVDDSAVPSPQELIVRLRDMREGSGEARGILVLGHEDASHAAVVMVLDAGAEAGMQDIRMALDNMETE